MQHLYRGVTWRRGTDAVASVQKVAYLTFDDGPIPEATPGILDVLGKYGVKATFFAVGDNVLKYPDIYARVIKEGHRVGNHTMHHMKGIRFPKDVYLVDIDTCEQVMSHQQSAVSNQQSEHKLFRPPYGRMTYGQKRAILERGYEIILWDVLTHDYNPRYSPERMLDVVKRYTRNGSIINFHDSVKSADRTIRVLPDVIEWLQQQGYEIRTL